MRRLVFLLASALSALSAYAQLSLDQIHVRDPYILADEQTGFYYLYRRSEHTYAAENQYGSVEVLKSRDLKTWTEPKEVFRVPEGNWTTGIVWAPEVHRYKDRYYLFATFTSALEWKQKKENWPAYVFRGTQIFYADSPEGPFRPFDIRPHTPLDWMALDGTLWVEDEQPYMIFCREWVETVDGTMELQKLESDLSAPVGRPMRLFCASSAPWVMKPQRGYVTDGCFLYRTSGGRLLMIWSSFTDKGYAIGIASSVTGSVIGPWEHAPQPLLKENGGHGMIFRGFDDKLYLVLHQPNDPAGEERAKIIELVDTGESLIIKQ